MRERAADGHLCESVWDVHDHDVRTFRRTRLKGRLSPCTIAPLQKAEHGKALAHPTTHPPARFSTSTSHFLVIGELAYRGPRTSTTVPLHPYARISAYRPYPARCRRCRCAY